MKTFRKVLFWVHLCAGALSGVVIFIMCVTGALLSFERQITEYSERDVRYASQAANAIKLEPQQIIDDLREAKPESKPSSMMITNEPGAAWQINLGRDGMSFVDPYSGQILGQSNSTVRAVMSEFKSWHRYVAFSGDKRDAGKTITGVSNILFLFLAISGIYIWFPRNLSWRTVKPVIWFRRNANGKARDFNWHNTIGFWCSLFLIVFTLTATVISFQWASNLLYTITGNEVPPAAGGNQSQQQDKPYEFPTSSNAAWKRAFEQASTWKSVSLRIPIDKNQAVFTIDEGIYWNIFGRSTLTIDSTTGEVTKWDTYGSRNSAQQLRSWFRFTHTGESGGVIGQFVGFIACVGGAFLVWTGFSLALRRFGNWRKRRGNGVIIDAEI